VLLGFGVGAVIVAQILFADVTDHLDEYATLKEIGSGDRFLYALVLGQGVILGFLGFLPGLAVSLALYSFTASATGLPMVFDPRLGALVLVLTVAMGASSGALALRKVQRADPAEVF
jgi:putative ABC transport system permease protein